MQIKTKQRLSYILLLALSAATAVVLYPILNKSTVLLHQAEILKDKGMIEESDALVAQAVEKGSRRPAPVLRAARLYLEEGREAKAVSLLNETLSSMRTVPPGLPRRMAGLLDSYNHPAEALHLMLQTNPDRFSRNDRLYLADLLRRQKRYDEAMKEYSILLEETPSDTEAALRRVETLTWMEDLDAALPLARQLVRSNPENRPARLLLARILYWTGYVDEAEAEYKRLLGENL